ncbi:MAG: TerC family protein [Phycisphaeraceae bacterium]|nr:TerC family protein [Phycisphaeraceae bacterium]
MLLYGVFIVAVIGLLCLDLFVFHRKAHAVRLKEALGWSAFWVSFALLFTVPLYFAYEQHWFGLGMNVPVMGEAGTTKTVSGLAAMGEYFTGYVIELSLSMDNLFVMAVIFGSLKVPKENQHRVLFWGILGAIIMRGLMIVLGVALIKRFDWIIYVFGAILIFTAIKMAFTKENHDEPSLGPIARLLGRFFPITQRLDGQRFLIRIDGRRHATPLLVALIAIEFTDLIFAVDSIPAIFAITADPFIVFTSNIMAILGLRSLYSCLSAMLHTFRFLKPALVVVLMFIGVKMCLIHTALKIPNEAALGIVVGILATGIVASLLAPHPRPRQQDFPTAPELPGREPSGGERADG